MGRREQPTLSRYRQSHLHSCGHVDDCLLQRPVAEAEPCRDCKSAKFNREHAGTGSKPPLALVRVGDVGGLAW